MSGCHHPAVEVVEVGPLQGSYIARCPDCGAASGEAVTVDHALTDFHARWGADLQEFRRRLLRREQGSGRRPGGAELMDFYDELQEREQRRSIEADYQCHLRRDRWPEEPHPNGSWPAPRPAATPTGPLASTQNSSSPGDGCTSWSPIPERGAAVVPPARPPRGRPAFGRPPITARPDARPFGPRCRADPHRVRAHDDRRR
jgi:hypothetical protein